MAGLRTPALPPPVCWPACRSMRAFSCSARWCWPAWPASLALTLASAPAYALPLAANAASWLAGFVIIGAPAGLGVREATFVALAGAALGEGQALLLIGLFRVVTFLGDTLFLAAGALLLRLRRGARSGRNIRPTRESEHPPAPDRFAWEVTMQTPSPPKPRASCPNARPAHPCAGVRRRAAGRAKSRLTP